MALTATYYYCNSGGGTSSKTVTLTVGSESQYFSGTEGNCQVTKKRRKITASISSAISETLYVRFDYLYKMIQNYGDYVVEYRSIETIKINAGSTSGYKYVDTYVRSVCSDGSVLRDSGMI